MNNLFRKKIYIFLFYCFLIFFLFPIGVNAATFTRDNTVLYNSYVKKYMKVGDEKITAYCVDHHLSAPSRGARYSEYEKWDNATCKYKTVKDIDCSVMSGYIIAASNTLGGNKKLTANQKYILSQFSLQTFLYKWNRDAWGSKNGNFINKNVGGVVVNDVLKTAYKNYKAYVNSGGNVNNSGANVNLTITKAEADKHDNVLYYNPLKKAYYSYKVTVNVSGSAADYLTIIASLVDDDKSVRFCTKSAASYDSNSCSKSIKVSKSRTMSFYVVSTRTDSFKIEIKAKYQKVTKTKTRVNYKDTTMWRKNTNPRYNQKFLTYETNSTTIGKKVVKKKEVSQNISFSVKPVTTKDCNVLYKGYDTSGKISITGRTCANNSITNKKPTSAEYNSCKIDSNSVKLHYYRNSSCSGKGYDANLTVAIGQYGKFNLGTLSSDTSPIIKGQGFYLTDFSYINSISWKNSVVYNVNNNIIPYVYLDNSGTLHHNDTIYYKDSFGVCKSSKFDDYVRNANVTFNINSSNLNKIFKTYVNDSSKLKYVDSIVKSGQTGNSDVKLSEGKVYNQVYEFEAPYAYFDSSGTNVEYSTTEKSDEKSVFAGQRYYTLLKYDKDTFPFNVNTDKLSFVDGITWELDGLCSVDLCTDDECPTIYKDGELNYTYRTIDTSKPFPKSIASNWLEYQESDRNFNRINSSFDKIYYSTILNSESLNKVDVINSKSSYTSFENMTNDGKSSFVGSDDGLSFSLSNSNSYCPLGQYNSSCDVR